MLGKINRKRKGQTALSTRDHFMGRNVIWSNDPYVNPNGEKYMTRFWFWRFRLHFMHRGDVDLDLHDHPWWFITFPLRSYVEEVMEPVPGKANEWNRKLNVVRAFRFHFRPRSYVHRILGPLPPRHFDPERFFKVNTNDHLARYERHGISTAIPTLVFRGKFSGKWGFYPDIGGEPFWVPAEVYFAGPGSDEAEEFFSNAS